MSMQICENCTVEFESPTDSGEVKTARVLCKACLTEHMARKRARAAASSGANRGSVDRAVNPQRPRDAVDSARVAPAAARNGKAGKAPHDKASIAVQEGNAVKENQQSRRPLRREPEQTRESSNVLIERRVQQMRAHAKRQILFGFGGVLLLGIIAGVVFWRVLSVRRAEAAAEQARIEAQNEVYDRIMGTNPDAEEESRTMLTYAEQADIKAIWMADERAPDVINRIARVRENLERSAERRDLTQRFEALEVEADALNAASAEDLARLARDLDALLPKAPLVGPEFWEKVTERLAAVDDARCTRLVEDARAAAHSISGAETGRAALVAYAMAEEGVQKKVDAAYKVWQENKSDTALHENFKGYEALYKQVIRESDDLGMQVYTDEFVAATPWIDLLSPERAGNWVAANVQGFSHSMDGGVLNVVGPDADARGDGILSIGDAEKWRDFALEFEITLAKGKTTLFLRLGRTTERVENTEIAVDDGESFTAGEPITVEILFTGSSWTCYAHSESNDPGMASPFAVPITSQRRGAIGFGVPSGTEFRVSKMRIKVLR